MLTLAETLAHHKITILPDFSLGKMQREGSQWLRAYTFPKGQLVYFGDYKTSLSEKWEGLESMTAAEEREHRSQVKKAQTEMKAERDAEQIRVKLKCQAEWGTKIDRGTTDYLERKKIPELYGAKIDRNDHGAFLLVPARDIEGELWNWQRVYNTKFTQGDKFFLPGARIEGLFHILCPVNADSCIYIAEGFATAASIAQALPSPSAVVCAFNAGNLSSVAQALRARYPSSTLVLCADHDQWTQKPDGTPYNPGLSYANQAAKLVGGSVVSPRFQDLSTRPTDFNDLHCLEGLDAVREQLLKPQAAGLPEPQPKLTEQRIAERVLSDWEGRLVRQEKSLFQYRTTHWVEMEDYDIDQIKNHINRICGDKLPSKTVNSIYSTFFRQVPHVPEGTNLFVPNPLRGNFLDGTLTLTRDERSGVYTTYFRGHDPNDFLTWCIPLKWNCDRSIKNAKFETLLDEALQGETDAIGIRRALRQMAGAMLVPTFSQMFILHGVSGSRKSTIALTLAKLVADANMSAVDPARMQGFEIEGMIGKLVNMHTDIDDHVPMPRGFIKMFEDNKPIQVNRKGKVVVRSRIAKVHIFCANQLPPNFEGSGDAFMRRITLLLFKNDLTHGKDKRQLESVLKHYEDVIWAAGYEGILNFAREGLDDLVCSGGKFYQPQSSLAGIMAWQSDKDPVAQFLQGVEEGEILSENTQVKRGETRRILPALLWLCFVEWHKTIYRFEPRLTRFAFYTRIQTQGIIKVRIQGREHFAGIGAFEVESSKF